MTPINNLKHHDLLFQLKRIFSKAGFYLISIVILIGALALIGWQFNIEALKRPIPHLVAMNPATAVSFILTGISFFLITAGSHSKSWSSLSLSLLWLVILISLLKIAGELFPSLPAIDHLLYPRQIQADAKGNLSSSMAANTSLGFIFSGCALLLINNKKTSWRMTAHLLAFAVFIFGFFSLIGYLFHATEFYDLLSYLPMAMHTAICFILISLAILFVYPDQGIAKEIFNANSGGAVGRSLLPAAVILPVLLGLLVLYAYKINLFSTELSTTLLVLSLILTLCISILFSVILLNKKDVERMQVEEKLRQSEEVFRSLVTSIRDYAIIRLDVNGNIVTWNKGAASINGYEKEEVKGKNFAIFFRKEDVEKNIPEQMLRIAKEKGSVELENYRIRKNDTEFWANMIITALYNHANELTGFASITRDMTEKKKTTDMLADFNKVLSREVREKTKALEETAVQLRELYASLQNAREEERKKIAREIHDELGQMLTGLRMDIVWLRKNLTPQSDVIKTRLERTLELLTDTRQTMRRISTDLHPVILEDLGLEAAIELQCREFESRSGIKTNFVSDLTGLTETAMMNDIKIGLYRVFQESLTNIAKHAEASHVNVFLKLKGGNISLGISDDGKGFNMDEIANKKSLGLVSIRERALMMNGKHEIHSIPGDGTTLLLIVPVS